MPFKPNHAYTHIKLGKRPDFPNYESNLPTIKLDDNICALPSAKERQETLDLSPPPVPLLCGTREETALR